MAVTRAGASGSVSGAKRATTCPERLTRNFSKFHRISGSGLGAMPKPFSFSLQETSERLIALG